MEAHRSDEAKAMVQIHPERILRGHPMQIDRRHKRFHTLIWGRGVMVA